MNDTLLYTDSLIEITANTILFKHYSLWGKDRLVFLSDIEKIVVKETSFWRGKFRYHGTGDLKTWFPKDTQRYKRDKIFIAFICNRWWRIGFTVENSTAIKKIFLEKGLIKTTI